MIQESTTQRHLLVMVEAAQRAGLTEKEIVGLVAEQSGEDTHPDRGNLIDLGFVRRLLGRAALTRAA